MRSHLTVPGRLDYDARSRIDYDSPVDGIVSRISVAIRQKVCRGDSLAEISSTEVGVARDEVMKREADREIARKAADWTATIGDNVQSLLGMLEGHPPLEGVEQEFAGRVLGDYREKILGAYSRLVYVEKVNAGTRSLGDGGVLSGRIVEERTSNLEVARASFAAACESAKFDTLQEQGRAKAALEQSERLLRVSQENLRNLVGGRLEPGTPDALDDDDGSSSDAGISAISLRTPVDGIVEEIFVSRGERVQGGDRMLVAKVFRPLDLLNSIAAAVTARVVEAEIRETVELGLDAPGFRGSIIVAEAKGAERQATVHPGRVGRSYLKLSDDELARLLLGQCDPAEAAAAGRLEASTQVAQKLAAQLFPRTPLWCPMWDDLPA